MTPLPPLLTIEEVAEIVRQHENTVGRWAREGRIKAFKLPGGLWRVPREEVEAVLRGERATRDESAA
jgi:excisionase family DNA binding protein